MKTNPIILGGFVLGAIVLAVVASIYLGAVHVFSKPGHFVVYFEEPVDGVERGSGVKLQGVRIGRVSSLQVVWNPIEKKPGALVVCEVDRQIMIDTANRPFDIAQERNLAELVNNGLRAKLGLEGISGLKFVGLSFYDPKTTHGQKPPPGLVSRTTPVVIPSVESTLSEISDNLASIIRDVKQINFSKISKELTQLLAGVNEQMTELQRQQFASKLAQAADSIQRLASSPELGETIRHLDSAVQHVEKLSITADAQAKPVLVDFQQTLVEARKTLESLNSSAGELNQLLQARGSMGAEAWKAMRQVNDAALAIQRLAEFLEQNPNAILTGKENKGWRRE